MNVLISSATSQIGFHVARGAQDRGADVIAGVHARVFREWETAPRIMPWNLARTDGGSVTALKRTAAGREFQCLIHCGDLSFAATAARDAAALGVGAAIAFSSSSVRFRRAPPPIGDPTLVAALEAAALSFERECEALGIVSVLLYPTMIYGAAMDRNISRLAELVSRWPVIPLPSPAEGLRQPVHAQDLARMALELGSGALGGRIEHGTRLFVGGGERLVLREILDRIALAIGREPAIVQTRALNAVVRIASGLSGRGTSISSALERFARDQVVDNTSAIALSGVRPRGFQPTRSELLCPPDRVPLDRMPRDGAAEDARGIKT